MTHTASSPSTGAFNNLVIYNGYPISVIVAVAFHSILLAGLVYFQGNYNPDTLELIQPTVIKALFIDENPQDRNERIIEQQRVQRQEDQRRVREEETQRQQQLEREQQEAAEQQRREQEADRERTLLLEREALERQQELERQRTETERLELQQRERDRLAEEQRQRDQAETQRRQQETERIRQQQDAANEAAAVEAARTEFELVQSATALIQQLVQEQWSRPPSARNGMRVVVQISMMPNGDLLGATITESSGDPAFDRSAENAVYGAAPFRELTTLPINVFNQNFRTLSLIFQPEDLLN